jgi:hypothetical protein
MRTYPIKFLPIAADGGLHCVICSSLWCLAAGVPAMRSAVRLGGAGADARGGLLPRGLPVRTVRPRPSGSPMHQLLRYSLFRARKVRIRPLTLQSALRNRIRRMRMLLGQPDLY